MLERNRAKQGPSNQSGEGTGNKSLGPGSFQRVDAETPPSVRGNTVFNNICWLAHKFSLVVLALPFAIQPLALASQRVCAFTITVALNCEATRKT